MPEGKRFKIGLVRCDTHGYWYGAFMEDCDTLLLLKHRNVVRYYFTDSYSGRNLIIKKVPGFELVKVCDPDPLCKGYSEPGRADKLAETFLGKPQVCETLGEMVDDIDAVFIADSTGDGSDHLILATPFLKRGIPTFVDKPFAATLKDAKEIIKLAQENNTVVMSASLLDGYTDTAMQFKAKLFKGKCPDDVDNDWMKYIFEKYKDWSDEIGPVGLAVVKGIGGDSGLAGIIHGIAMAHSLFGDGVEWVECMGSLPMEYLLLHYYSGQEAVVINASKDLLHPSCSYFCSVYSGTGTIQNRGVLHSPPIGDPEFLSGTYRIVSLFKQMLETRKPPISYTSLLEPFAIIEAGQIAQKERKRVYLKNVMKDVKNEECPPIKKIC